MCVIKIPEEEEKGNAADNIVEVIMAKNVQKLMTDTQSQIQEVREHLAG